MPSVLVLPRVLFLLGLRSMPVLGETKEGLFRKLLLDKAIEYASVRDISNSGF